MSEIITPEGIIEVSSVPAKKLAFAEELQRYVDSPRNDIRLVIIETLDRIRYFNITDQISSVYKDITRGYIQLRGGNKTVAIRYVPIEEPSANGKQNMRMILNPIQNQRIIPVDKVMNIDIIENIEDFKEILRMIGNMK